MFLEGILQMSMALRILCTFFICLALLVLNELSRMSKLLLTYRAIISHLLIRLLPELLTLFL